MTSGPEGTWLAAVEDQTTIRLLDQQTFEPVGEPLFGTTGSIWKLEFNKTGELLASRSADALVRMWSTESRQQIGRELPGGSEMTWSPDGTRLVLPEERGNRVWNFDTSTWADIACEVAGRNLTQEEWDEFGPRTSDYRPTCPQYAIEP